MFDTPFGYDGRSDLVIEIQKEVTSIASGIATMGRDGNPGRLDLPRAVYVFGPVSLGSNLFLTNGTDFFIRTN